jgi:hypothetical protein
MVPVAPPFRPLILNSTWAAEAQARAAMRRSERTMASRYEEMSSDLLPETHSPREPGTQPRAL